MAIKFAPARKTILLCNFDAGGFRPPEMVKRRPVVVLNERLPQRDGLVNVVPLSGTAPPRGCTYQCLITLEELLPQPFDGQLAWWVKADMIATVGYERLDMCHSARDQEGKRKYLKPKVSDEQFAQICSTVLAALRLAR